MLGQPGNLGELDAFLMQLAGLFVRGLAIDAAGFRLAVVDLARFLGEAAADIVAIGLDLRAKLAQLPADLGGLGGHLLAHQRTALAHRRLGCLAFRRGSAFTLPLADTRRHGCLLHLGAATGRAGDLAAGELLLGRRSVAEPGFGDMTLAAFEIEENHLPVIA